MNTDLKFAAFTDESNNQFSGQIDACLRHGYSHIELRNLDGKNFTKLTLEEAEDIKEQLSKHGLSILTLGSPIGKMNITGDFDEHLNLFRHTLELAKVFGTKYIRIFSFYVPKGEEPDAYRDLIMEKLAVLVEEAKAYDVILCHENEKGIYGDTPERCLEIHQAIPELRAVFDPANFVQCQQDTLKAWDMLAPYVEYLHIKDALWDGQNVPPGDGEGHLADILRAYCEQGGNLVTLEPHLYEFVGLKNLEREGEESLVGALAFSSSEEAFDFAAGKLRELVEQLSDKKGKV